MTFNPVPKPSYKSKKVSKNFTPGVKKAIFERDNHHCVKCGSPYIESVPHHIIYKSQGGTGEKRNGATVCRPCHDWGHHKRDSIYGEPSKDGRQWFVDWMETKLDENGDYIR